MFYKNVETAGTMGGIPGGNVRGLYLVGPDASIIGLDSANNNIGIVQQLFGTFETVSLLTPTQYLGTSTFNLTFTVYLAGAVDMSIIIPPTPYIPFPQTPDETNILIQASSIDQYFSTDSPGFLIPYRYNPTLDPNELARAAGLIQ